MEEDKNYFELIDLLYGFEDSDAYIQLCLELIYSNRIRFSGVLGTYIRMTLDDVCVAVIFNDDKGDEICALADPRINNRCFFEDFLLDLSDMMINVLSGYDLDETHIQITNNVVDFFMKGDDKISDDAYRIGYGEIVSAKHYKEVISCELAITSETYSGRIIEYPDRFELIHFSPYNDNNPNEPIHVYKQKN